MALHSLYCADVPPIMCKAGVYSTRRCRKKLLYINLFKAPKFATSFIRR